MENQEMSLATSEKTRFLKDLISSGIFYPLPHSEIESRFPFFDKTLARPIDYMTIWDLLQLSGYTDDSALFAVLLCVFDALQEGSICMNLGEKTLAERLEFFCPKTAANEISKKFLTALDSAKYERLISRNRDEYKPLVVVESGNRKLLYFQKYFVFEKKLKRRILHLLSQPFAVGVNAGNTDELIEQVFSAERTLNVRKDGPPIKRDADQIQAIKLALSSRFCIISGGPGTGKTSLMVNILRCFVRSGLEPSEIILCAPTGRAAQRMTEAIYSNIATIHFPEVADLKINEIKAATLHKVLHFQSRWNDFFFNEENRLPASLVIMDEATMVDVILMEKFLRAIDLERARLILLGDKDQLPSVEAGAVFAEMMPGKEKAEAFRDRLVVLKKTYRSVHKLQQLAEMVNSGLFPVCKPVSLEKALSSKKNGWCMVEPDTEKRWENDLKLWADSQLLNSPESQNVQEYLLTENPKSSPRNTLRSSESLLRLDFKTLIRLASTIEPRDMMEPDAPYRFILDEIFQKSEKCRILTIVRKGVFGAVAINRFLGGYLKARLNAAENNKENLFSGALITITRNDYSKELFNGDSGAVIRDPDGIFRSYFRRSGSYINWRADLLNAWEPAYALTVHRCQGSEFDKVMVVLPRDEKHKLLTRQMVYTAVTRAKKKVVIYGKSQALAAALEKKIKRESGLSW